jgi:ubiquinone/menaquinone biosynthesis C-methylase UbiE
MLFLLKQQIRGAKLEYYRSHWINIDSQRLATYDEMFQWTPLHDALIQDLLLDEFECAVDYGCGPGWVSLELARRIKDGGRVVGCDINQEFLSLAKQHAADAGLGKKVQWCHVTEDRVPIPDSSADFGLCKNVLGYVDSLDDMLAEILRVLKSGGIIRMLEPDWDLLVVEPLGSERLNEMLLYAKHAFSDPQVGRNLYGSAKRAGYTNVEVKMVPVVDTLGFLVKLTLENFIQYAIDGGYPPEKGKQYLADLHTALKNNELLIVLPFFMVTGTVP